MKHVTNGASYTAGTATAALGTFSANEVAAVGGIIVAAATFVVNLIYHHRAYQLEKRQTSAAERESQLRIRKLTAELAEIVGSDDE
jgi:hypothetical protein